MLLLCFVTGFLLLNLDYIITALILLFIIVIIIINRKFTFKKSIKFIVALLGGTLIYGSISQASNSTEYVDNGVFIVKRAKENYIIVSNYFSNYYVYEKANEYDEGDILKISGRVKEFTVNLVESQYDFSSFLKTYGVKHQLNPKSIEVLLDNPFSTKALAKNYIDKYNENAKVIISSMNFGVKDYDSEIFTNYQNLNLVSLLSNSGMFFSFTMEALTLIFLLAVPEKKAKIGVFIVTFPYLLFNLFSFGLRKVYLLNLLKFIVPKIDKISHWRYLHKISLAGLILVLFDPLVILRLEFVLSMGLSLLNAILRADIIKNVNGMTKFRVKFWMEVKIRVLIFVLFIPINLAMNNNVNIFIMFSQVIFIPIFKILYFASYLSFFIGYNPLLNYCFIAVNFLIQGVEKISFNIYAPPLGPVALHVYYILYVLFIMCYEKGYMDFVRKFALMGTLAIIISFVPIKNAFTTEVYFLNVGQGDCTIIKHHYTTIMIDTGGLTYMDLAKESLIPFLKKHRIYNIDTLFITHEDFDHSGARENLVKNFHVSEIVTEKSQFPYEKGGLTFQNLNETTNENRNDSSLVLHTEIKENKFLFMGDASKEIEWQIIEKYPDLKATYLKVGHHGSNTSTSEEFVKVVQPDEAIISCGIKNNYGHPNIETLAILEKYDVKIRRTDIEGTILYNL